MRLGPVLAALVVGCAQTPAPDHVVASTSSSSALSPRPNVAAVASASAVDPPPPPVAAKPVYPWLDDATLAFPAPVDALDARFSPPAGFTRVKVEEGSFGAFTRSLPLAAEGTPVVSFAGGVLHPASDPRIAAVVAIDVGKHDLQQCADSIVRLHAEWLWSLGRRDESYRAASGADMPFVRWLAGERVVADGMSIAWKKMTKPSAPTHPVFRAYLDAVFGWANTGSISKQGAPVDVADLAPGDYVVSPGAPGHAVLVLDVARAADGRRVALLGQGYMPAQSFQILRASDGSPWFTIDPSKPLDTPFWDPFPWTSLRRLGE